MKSAQTVVLLATLGVSLSGCANMNNTQGARLVEPAWAPSLVRSSAERRDMPAPGH